MSLFFSLLVSSASYAQDAESPDFYHFYNDQIDLEVVAGNGVLVLDWRAKSLNSNVSRELGSAAVINEVDMTSLGLMAYPGEADVTVVLFLVDVGSNATAASIEQAREYILTSVARSGPHVIAGVAEFDHEARRIADFTNDMSDLSMSLEGLSAAPSKTQGGAGLALVNSLDGLSNAASSRRAVILLTPSSTVSDLVMPEDMAPILELAQLTSVSASTIFLGQNAMDGDAYQPMLGLAEISGGVVQPANDPGLAEFLSISPLSFLDLGGRLAYSTSDFIRYPGADQAVATVEIAFGSDPLIFSIPVEIRPASASQVIDWVISQPGNALPMLMGTVPVWAWAVFSLLSVLGAWALLRRRRR